jgi:hypothetical protein
MTAIDNLYLGNLVLPAYGELTELTDPNASEIMTLDASLHVDFVNYRRGWNIGWKLLKADDYNLIRAKFNEQFASGVFHNFGIPTLSINVPVYMKINDKNIKWNGSFVEGFSIELLEQDAVS